MAAKSALANVHLKSFDEIFSAQNTDVQNNIQEIELAQLHEFKNHPFKVLDDEKMEETLESVKKYGVLVPGIVRPCDGSYEIIAGHRRKRACELAGLVTMPVLIRNLDNEEATIIMVDSNIQRENLLFSEKAFAFKMKLEAIRKKVGRPSKINCAQLGQNSCERQRSIENIAENVGESRMQVQRYIRLTELLPELLNMVDAKKLPFITAVEISYLLPQEQEIILSYIKNNSLVPSLAQAKQLRTMSQAGDIREKSVNELFQNKEKDAIKITFSSKSLRQYFPAAYSAKQMSETIESLLKEWAKTRGAYEN